MTTMQTTPRPSPAAPPRAASGPQGGAGGGVGAGPSVDPIRLLRQYKLAFFVASVIGLIAGLSAYYTLLRFAPQYRSSVMYLANPPTGRITDPNRPTTDPQELDRFMQTEIRVMTSPKLLREACQERRLLQGQLQWAKQFQPAGSATLNLNAAVRDLSERVGAKVVAGSQLMELSVTGPTIDDAEMLAIALHKAYFEELRKRGNIDSGERRDTLEAKRIQNDKELIKAQNEIQDLIGTTGLDSLTASDTVVSRDIDLAQSKLIELQGAITRYEEDVKRMERELADEGGLNVGADIREEAERDPSVVSIKNDIANLNSIMAAKIKTLGPNNPDVNKIRAQIEAKQKEVDKSVTEAKTRIFDSRLAQTRQMVNSLQVQIAVLTDTIGKKTLKKVEYLKATKDIQTKTDLIAQLTETRKEIRDALDALATDDTTKDVRRGRVRLLDDPKRPDEVSFPKLSIMLALGLFLSLGLTGSVVILREVLDQRIKGPSDITIMPRMKLLGMVPIAADDPSKPGAPETAFRDSASGAIAESFRQMRPAIVKRMAQSGHKSLLIAGAMPQSGSTTVAANFAMACAAADQRVLLIDANFRRPALHKIFKLGEGPGLGEVLCRKNSLDEAVQQTSVPNLHLLASGTPTARSVPERLATEAMTDVIREAGAKYDLVIVDTAPMMVAGDGLALSNRCDCVLLVVRAMAEKRGLVARIRDQLSESKGEFIGAVVNAVRASTGGYMKRNMRTSYEYHNNGATV